MEAVRRPGSPLVGLPREEPQAQTNQAVILRRIDCLLDLGAKLSSLPESLADEESKPGRLPGSFYVTRLPLLLKQIELSVTAIRALGGQPPRIVEDFVADPERFRQEGTKLILAALEEVDAAIAGESLATRPSARLQRAH